MLKRLTETRSLPGTRVTKRILRIRESGNSDITSRVGVIVLAFFPTIIAAVFQLIWPGTTSLTALIIAIPVSVVGAGAYPCCIIDRERDIISRQIGTFGLPIMNCTISINAAGAIHIIERPGGSDPSTGGRISRRWVVSVVERQTDRRFIARSSILTIEEAHRYAALIKEWINREIVVVRVP